jgi:PAS domain S-box-containing protein
MDGAPNLLLVDDDETTRRALVRLFRTQFPACAVTECGDGTEALTLLIGGRYDCVFLDYRLPGQDGLEVLRGARAAGVSSPIVILTGEGSEELAVEMMKAGADDYVVKGRMTPDGLARAVRHAVRVREAESRTAAARAEQAASEERFRRLVEVAEDGVWIVDAEGVTTFVNAGAARMIGYGPEEIVGRSPLDFMHDEESRGATAAGFERRRQGFRERRECVMRHRDGSPVWVIVAAAPLGGPAGEYAGAFAVLTDVTREKRTEQALRESEERFRRVFEDGPVGMAMTGMDRRLIAVNAAFGRLVGREPASLVGVCFDDITHPEDVSANAELADRMRREEVLEYRMDKRYLRPDGTVAWAALTSSVIRDAAGRASYMLTIVEDVTERRKAEEELKASEARFRSLFEASPLAISLSVGMTTLYVNPAYVRMFGYERADEVVGHPLTERVAPASRREVMDRLARQARDGTVAAADSYEAVGRRRDGSEFPYHVRVAQMQVPEGVANLAFITDLTEQKQAEAGLRASEARFRSLFEASPLAIELSVDGVSLYANPAYVRMFGFGSEAEVVGSRVVDRVAPSARGMIADRMARRDRGEPVPDAYETAGVRCDGTEFPLYIRITRMATAEGMAHLAFIADLTEQKRAEAALNETSRTLEGVFAASPLAIAVLDRAGYVRMWNPAAERVFGWSAGEVAGKMFPLVTASDDRDQFDDLHRRLLAGRGFEGIEGSVRRKGGGMVDISASGAPLTGADGSVTGIVFVCADMTEPNRLREQLLQSQKMESLGRLAGGIAHDFNNLLAVIGGYAESVRRRVGEGHAARPQVEEIERAAERGARLVRQLLAFSRSRPARAERVDVATVIGDVCQMLRRVLGSQVAVERGGDGRAAWVEADPVQVEQMLVNLALNARDAMPRGGTLTFETTHLDVPAVAGSHPAGRFVALVVRDTGEGMDAPTQSRVFEPFFTTKAEGTGLGLSIVYGIVRQMGGHVSVSSEPGRGTRFEILLPAAMGEGGGG